MKEWQTLSCDHPHGQERAIDTYIMPFNIFVTPEFARAHQVAMDNLEHHFSSKEILPTSSKDIPGNA
ncbi:MAG: hypothetical protein IPO69_04295 [Saprospiraceae bacterium]|nr:hypothetical protein [Saprospiraceae bacterium]